MRRALALVLLLACGGLQACATAIIGSGSSGQKCEETSSQKCPR